MPVTCPNEAKLGIQIEQAGDSKGQRCEHRRSGSQALVVILMHTHVSLPVVGGCNLTVMCCELPRREKDAVLKRFLLIAYLRSC